MSENEKDECNHRWTYAGDGVNICLDCSEIDDADDGCGMFDLDGNYYGP